MKKAVILGLLATVFVAMPVYADETNIEITYDVDSILGGQTVSLYLVNETTAEIEEVEANLKDGRSESFCLPEGSYSFGGVWQGDTQLINYKFEMDDFVIEDGKVAKVSFDGSSHQITLQSVNIPITIEGSSNVSTLQIELEGKSDTYYSAEDNYLIPYYYIRELSSYPLSININAGKYHITDVKAYDADLNPIEVYYDESDFYATRTKSNDAIKLYTENPPSDYVKAKTNAYLLETDRTISLTLDECKSGITFEEYLEEEDFSDEEGEVAYDDNGDVVGDEADVKETTSNYKKPIIILIVCVGLAILFALRKKIYNAYIRYQIGKR
ncbi:hypothetical protein [Eubacterium oxidoreducens]|uniref:hypothetical protein n=1 Tax=Eubacterium oxidoreducens TaxID=1732 RepID=UPI00115FAAEE|nr:hypothetical protein [Eubacterium oxidoreducens]